MRDPSGCRDTYTQLCYGEKPPFAGFLPGIAGERGIPVWCYTCNRGQGVAGFGLRDKDHAVMEFSPAHTAYQNTRYKGFRTFLKYGDRVIEAFEDRKSTMYIRPNELEISWQNDDFRVDVVYFTVPSWRLGALARQVRVTNISGIPQVLTLLDGLPAVVCAGVGQDALKNMAQLSKAWMQVEDSDTPPFIPYYRVRFSMADTAVIHPIPEGNFAVGMLEDGTFLRPVVDPEAVFGSDTSLTRPLGFEGTGDPLHAHQAVSNLFPCAFFMTEDTILYEDHCLEVNELYGGADSRDILHRVLKAERLDGKWFGSRREQSRALAESLTTVMDCRTADPAFDSYCRQTYLDNMLRGGEPVRLCGSEEAGTENGEISEEDHGIKEKEHIVWIYSRKHGDMEREYNYFVMTPEYFSQGNGNFRDVCQNRRSDVLFHPWVGDAVIRLFFSLIQPDGYNPLVIGPTVLKVPEEKLGDLADSMPADQPALRELVKGQFTPGQLFMAGEKAEDRTLRAILAAAESLPTAEFGEGYWCDHWTYCLDLIESYLAVWPDKKEELLFGRDDYLWYAPRARILPLQERGRDGRYLEAAEQLPPDGWMREDHGDGDIACSTLAEKLVMLCAFRFSVLDRAGMGIEMEGGKPGWYDALNGLPALNGSSVADSCELLRLLTFTAGALRENDGEIVLYDEMADLLEDLNRVCGSPEERWKQMTALRDAYRDRIRNGVDGGKTVMLCREAAAILNDFARVVRDGIDRAVAEEGGICPTYRMYPEGGRQSLPLFLEGPVRWLKLDAPPQQKRGMAALVKASGLYDRELRMYKVNESLRDLTYAAGRCRAFTPGWLENESVWLHMEYKYLLELLRSGLYPEFEQAFSDCLVPFMDPVTYGRSVYENVSFIVSSANPDPSLHGRGFVARLSGSTAEFLSMWQEMMFGPAPFRMEEGELTLRFRPMLPSRLIPEDGAVEAVLLGHTRVCYHINGSGSLVPGNYRTERITADGTEYGECLCGDAARAVRDGKIGKMDVYLICDQQKT